MIRPLIYHWIFLALSGLFLACADSAHGAPLRVFVSIEPQLECVKRIGGDLVSVEALVPAGASPETFVPSPRKMSALGKADMLIRIGVPFEKSLLDKIRRTFPKLTIVDGTAGMVYRKMEHETHVHDDDKDATEHHEDGMADGNGHAHAHDGMDPHVWLSIANMRRHAHNAADAIAAKLPEHASEIRECESTYDGELAALDRDIRKQLAPIKGKTAVVFHPAFGYFLNSYGLEQHAVELEGKEPTGRHLRELIVKARKDGVRCIFVQPQFNAKTAQVIASELGGKVIPLDPLPKTYSEGMRTLARQLLNIGNSP